MRRFVVALTLTLIGVAPAILADEPPPPVAVIANVLSLSDQQVASWVDLLRAREAVAQPLQQQLQATQQAIATQLQSPTPDAAEVGRLFIGAQAVEQKIANAVADTNARFEQLLTDEQRMRLGQIRGAAQVCPIVPALQATGLIPANR